MNKWNRIILAIGASVLLNGCASFTLKQSPPEPSPAASAAPQDDPRSVPQLRTENGDLRGKLAQAEKDLRGWRAAVDDRKSQLKGLERDCDRVKKERDEAKKAAKNKDKD